jgi:TonB family protein
VVVGLAVGVAASPCGAQQKPSSVLRAPGGGSAKPGQDGSKSTVPPGGQGQKSGGEKSSQQKQGPGSDESADQNLVKVEIARPIPPEDRENLKGYWAEVRSKVGQRWQGEASASGAGSDPVKIICWIHTDGSVTGLTVEHRSGSPAVDRAAMDAITGAAPYDAFPYGIAEEQVKVRFTFGSSAATGAPPKVVH